MAHQGNPAFFKTPTVLEQLLEEINFQRTKELRQLMKDDSGFVVLQGTSYWTDLFVRHFLFPTEHSIDCDDLLFFVRKKHIKTSSRYLPKFETEVDVFRKASRKLPIGDPDMDWEETVYLNLIIHQFDYTLTLAICTRTSPKELQVLRRHSQKVYASPSRRRMDTKAEAEEMTYPNICFMVDNFNEVFCDILVRDGEMVCVELVASDRDGTVQGVIFLGSIRYDALKRVYDARSSLSSKVAQRMTFGLFSNSSSQRVEFVRMKGPQGKGHAEMAVTKPKGYSGAETPTSEPGYCATDMWDSDWDSDPEDFFVYRHQRRLSDPSANINNFVRGGWKTKPSETAGAKARSENEGLDSLANGLNEIEAGDLRDDCEFCKHSTSTVWNPPISEPEPEPESSSLLESPPTSSMIASFFPVQKGRATEHSRVAVEATGSKSSPLPQLDEIGLALEISELKLEPKPNHTSLPRMTQMINVAQDVSHDTDINIDNVSDEEKITVDGDNNANNIDSLTSVGTNIPSVVVSPSLTDPKETGDSDDDDDFEDCFSSLSEATPVVQSANVSPEDSPSHREDWGDASDVCAHNIRDFCELCAGEKGNKKSDSGSNKSADITKTDLSAYQTAQDEYLSVKITQHGDRRECLVLPENGLKTDMLGSSSVDGKTEGCETDENKCQTNSKCKHGVEGSCILCGDRRPFFAKLREKHNTQITLLEKKNVASKIMLEKRCNFEGAGGTDSENKSDEAEASRSDEVKRPCRRCQSYRRNSSFPGPGSTRSYSSPTSPHSPNSPSRLAPARTLSRRRKTESSCIREATPTPPHRVMPDGTSIYYWCDVANRPPDLADYEHELDDGAYNPLWTMRGFTQTFHFWKENKRAQSVPLNAFLTYITLPCWSIVKDILDHREKPILTF